MLSYAEGAYDKLVCQRTILPEGKGRWDVGLYPTAVMLDRMNITDNSTGKPLEDVGAEKSPALAQLDVCLDAILRQKRRVTPEEFDLLHALTPDLATNLRGSELGVWLPDPPRRT